jgi:hypothetical protein
LGARDENIAGQDEASQRFVEVGFPGAGRFLRAISPLMRCARWVPFTYFYIATNSLESEYLVLLLLRLGLLRRILSSSLSESFPQVTFVSAVSAVRAWFAVRWFLGLVREELCALLRSVARVGRAHAREGSSAAVVSEVADRLSIPALRFRFRFRLRDLPLRLRALVAAALEHASVGRGAGCAPPPAAAGCESLRGRRVAVSLCGCAAGRDLV